MKGRIKIIRGTGRDTGIFLQFFRKCIRDLFSDVYSENSINFTLKKDYDPQYLKKELSGKRKILFFAFEKKMPAGFLIVTAPLAGVSYADWLAVPKNYQKKGIASSMLSSWQKYAEKEGAHSLFLWTTQKNLGFYRNRGFKVGGKFPLSWHGVDSYLIYKILCRPEEKNYLRNFLRKTRPQRAVQAG